MGVAHQRTEANPLRCPKCKSATEVLETRHTKIAVRRRRQCLNPHCKMPRFTTTESAKQAHAPIADEAALRARALAREFSSRVSDKEALEAALAVDMRRAAIARAQKAQRREMRDTWYDTDPTDPAPTHLDDESLRRELGQ